MSLSKPKKSVWGGAEMPFVLPQVRISLLQGQRWERGWAVWLGNANMRVGSCDHRKTAEAAT